MKNNDENASSDQAVKEFLLLREALREGIIDSDTLNHLVSEMKDAKYLEEHKKTIWQGKDGKYYTHIDKEGVRKLIKRNTKAEIEKYLIEFYKEQDPENKPTFEIIFWRWLKSKEKYHEVKTSSILRYEDDYRRFISGTAFEKMKVEDVNDIVLDEFVRTSIADKNLTAKSYSGLRTIVCGALKYAKRYHYTSFSANIFFKDLDLSKNSFKKSSNKRKIVYTKDERVKLYEYLRASNDIRDLGLAFMCLTGLRIGELSALKYEDNVGKYRLYVHRTEARSRDENGKIIFIVQDTPKMDHDEEIILPKAAQEIIDDVHERTKTSEYLFSIAGRRITTRVFRYRLKTECDKIGITYKPPHQMRKTYASILLSSGVDEALIKREMRHTDIQTTRSYYQFVTESLEAEKSIIDSVMGI